MYKLKFLSDDTNREIAAKIAALESSGVIWSHCQETQSCGIFLVEVAHDGTRHVTGWRIVGPTSRDDSVLMAGEVEAAFRRGQREGGFSIN